MPSIYTPVPTNPAQPLDTDYVLMGAAELRTLKGYTATQLAALGGPLDTSLIRAKNAIRNPSFSVWQRGFSGFTADGYTADGWRANSTGSTKSSSRQAFTLGQTAVPNEPAHHHRTIVTSVAGAGNFAWLGSPIESVRSFAGQTVTLSFYAKADAAKNIAVEMFQSFGTGGSPSAQNNLLPTTVALTTSWQRFSITVSVDSIAGKTIGTNGTDCLVVGFWFDAGSTYNSRTNSLGQQSGTFDIAEVELVPGGFATEVIRPTAEETLAACQRYTRIVNVTLGGGATPVAANRTYYESHSWSMRAAPNTLTLLNTDLNSNMGAVSWNSLYPYGGRASAANVVVNDCVFAGQYLVSAEMI
jgi:hypothetical protein